MMATGFKSLPQLSDALQICFCDWTDKKLEMAADAPVLEQKAGVAWLAGQAPQTQHSFTKKQHNENTK